MSSSRSRVLIALPLALCLTCCRSADAVIETVELQHLQARLLAGAFAPAEDTAEAQELQRQQLAVEFALGAISRAAQLPPRRRPEVLLVQGVSAATTGQPQYADMSDLLPEGLAGPPLAAPRGNALIVEGTPAAIDELREIVAMLDTPAPMVNVGLRLDEVHNMAWAGWLPNLQSWGWGGDAHVGGPIGGDTMIRYGTGNLEAILGVLAQQGQRRTMTEAQVTIESSYPAIVSVGEIRPWFAGEAWYDVWGQRHIDYFPYAVFTGITLWVLPQVNPDDTVTMVLRPSIVESGGKAAAIGPGDVLHRTLLETMVRVRDGQSLVVGGMRRRLDEQNQRWPIGGTTGQGVTDSVITVTPHIIRPIEP